MSILKQKLHDAWVGAYEYVTPPRTTSGFREKGVLTPEEFVEAGDNLVNKCPTWSWEAGDVERSKNFLPKDKQFLITRNVPCLRRVGRMEEDINAATAETVVDDDAEGGWLSTHGDPEAKIGEEEAIPSMEGPSSGGQVQGNSGQAAGGTSGTAGDANDDDDDDIPDINEFEDNDNVVEEDPAALETPYLRAEEPGEDNILRTRTYDISITYDKYYQTPRVFLFGYDEYKQPLRPEQVFEDISQDHAKKTVTIEDHPNLQGKHASIHPCRHGAVMKKILDVLCERGGEPRVDQYLFIFLKFIASVIPTIDYDYTVDFDLGSSRPVS